MKTKNENLSDKEIVLISLGAVASIVGIAVLAKFAEKKLGIEPASPKNIIVVELFSGWKKRRR